MSNVTDLKITRETMNNTCQQPDDFSEMDKFHKLLKLTKKNIKRDQIGNLDTKIFYKYTQNSSVNYYTPNPETKTYTKNK